MGQATFPGDGLPVSDYAGSDAANEGLGTQQEAMPPEHFSDIPQQVVLRAT